MHKAFILSVDPTTLLIARFTLAFREAEGFVFSSIFLFSLVCAEDNAVQSSSPCALII